MSEKNKQEQQEIAEENDRIFSEVAEEVPQEGNTKNADEESVSEKETTNEELNQMEEDLAEPKEQQEPETEQQQQFSVNFKSESPAEEEERKGVKDKADGKVLTVKEVSVTNPQTTKQVGGEIVEVEPEISDKGAQFYTVKLAVRYEEDNLVEYYPNLKIWVNNGKLNENVKIHRDGHSKVSQMFRMAVVKMAEEKEGKKFELVTKRINERPTLVIKDDQKEEYKAFEKTVSDEDFINFMRGRQIEIETSEGEYEGRSWFRNDWKKIL